MSAFQEWFEAQHGKRPGKNEPDDVSLRLLVINGKRAEQILHERQLYDARKNSALYAWQARERKVTP